MKKQLLCTFSDKKYLINTIRNILDVYIIEHDKIFIYELIDKPGQCICSYNITDTKKNSFMNYTISVHRKKPTNTFYTINALNQLIIELNNGVLDTNYSIDWEFYRDMLILINDATVKKDRLKFKEVYYIKPMELDNE